MKLHELKTQIADKEKRLAKIDKLIAEKEKIELELSDLKTQLADTEKEHNDFLFRLENAGLSLAEAEELLGLNNLKKGGVTNAEI